MNEAEQQERLRAAFEATLRCQDAAEKLAAAALAFEGAIGAFRALVFPARPPDRARMMGLAAPAEAPAPAMRTAGQEVRRARKKLGSRRRS